MPEAIQSIDENILFFIQEHMKSPVLDKIMVFITSLGNAGLIWVLIVLLFLLQKNYRRCGIYLAASLYLTMLLGDEILKPIIARVRPCNEFVQIHLLIARPHSFSFPSGHTIAGFAAATTIFYFYKDYGFAAYVLASLIAFSRMYLFVHYPTDILGGIIFGTLSSMLLIFVFNRIYEIINKKTSKD